MGSVNIGLHREDSPYLAPSLREDGFIGVAGGTRLYMAGQMFSTSLALVLHRGCLALSVRINLLRQLRHCPKTQGRLPRASSSGPTSR